MRECLASNAQKLGSFTNRPLPLGESQHLPVISEVAIFLDGRIKLFLEVDEMQGFVIKREITDKSHERGWRFVTKNEITDKSHERGWRFVTKNVITDKSYERG